MKKSFKLYGIIAIIVVALLILLRLGSKDPEDWSKNFGLHKKSPFGLFVFDQEAQSLLGGKLTRSTKSPANFYSKKSKQIPHNILIIERKLDGKSFESILEQVENGSDALLLMSDFPKEIQKKMHFLTTNVIYDDENILKLTDTKFLKDSLVLNKSAGENGFYYLDEEYEILGKSDIYESELQANFIKIPFGKGRLFLHSDPTFLTNYYLLKPNSQNYVQDVFSYLPKRETVWFTDFKTDSDSKQNDESPLSFILSQPPLKYAWRLLLFGLGLFVLFNAKRKQRIVPIISPLENKSVDFVRSIGNLYMQEGDFHDMMSKKVQYFLNKVRLELLIDTQYLDENFENKLHLKTGASKEKIKEATELMKKGKDLYASVTKEDLFRLNTLLDEIMPYSTKIKE